MIIGKDLKSLWEKHRQEFLKIHAEENRKPLGKHQLVKRLVDSNGIQWYGFPKEILMPVSRYSVLKKYMQYILKGLTPEEDKTIDESILDSVKESIRDPRSDAWAKITVLLQHKEKRRQLCVHSELYLNYLAVQLVREDEDPEIFDNDIQLQKVSQLKEELKKKGAYQFFQVPELKKLNDLLNMSEKEWMEYYEESRLQQEVLKQFLQVIRSSTTSTNKTRTSKPSS